MVNQARQTNEAHLSVRRGVSPSCDQTSCQAGQCLPFEFPQRERGGSEAEQRQTNPAKNGNDKKPKAGRKRESPRPHEKAGGPEKAKTKKNIKDSRRGTTDFFVRWPPATLRALPYSFRVEFLRFVDA